MPVFIYGGRVHVTLIVQFPDSVITAGINEGLFGFTVLFRSTPEKTNLNRFLSTQRTKYFYQVGLPDWNLTK